MSLTKIRHPHPLVKDHVLGSGWRLEPGDPLSNGRDAGPEGQKHWRLDWFVMGPKKASASLAFASDNSFCSDDKETPIPMTVMAKIEALYEQLDAAGLC